MSQLTFLNQAGETLTSHAFGQVPTTQVGQLTGTLKNEGTTPYTGLRIWLEQDAQTGVVMTASVNGTPITGTSEATANIFPTLAAGASYPVVIQYPGTSAALDSCRFKWAGD